MNNKFNFKVWDLVTGINRTYPRSIYRVRELVYVENEPNYRGLLLTFVRFEDFICPSGCDPNYVRVVRNQWDFRLATPNEIMGNIQIAKKESHEAVQT